MLKDAHFNIMATNSAQDKSQDEIGSSTTQYEKCYLTTAMREFRLTKWQIECALNEGVLQQLRAPNPHYKSGPLAVLLYRAEIEQNLNRLRSYPRFSPLKLQANNAKRTVAAAKRKLETKLNPFAKPAKPQSELPTATFPSNGTAKVRSLKNAP